MFCGTLTYYGIIITHFNRYIADDCVVAVSGELTGIVGVSDGAV
jgi:hypothetical protein